MTDMRRKLLWLIGGRAAVITGLLGSAIVMQLKLPGTLPIDPFFFLIGLTYGLTALWTLTLRFVDDHPWLVDVQVACDALVVSAMVHLTGGVASYFSSLYTLPTIDASKVT
jgi:two-component system sensor histidine kinase PilS (NtrC family)